jgi:hypothetical protein
VDRHLLYYLEGQILHPLLTPTLLAPTPFSPLRNMLCLNVLCQSPPASTRRLNAHSISLRQTRDPVTPHIDFHEPALLIPLPPRVLPPRAVLAPLETLGREHPSLGYDREVDGFSRLECLAQTVAADELAPPSRATTDLRLEEDQRRALLEDLYVGEPGVGRVLEQLQPVFPAFHLCRPAPLTTQVACFPCHVGPAPLPPPRDSPYVKPGVTLPDASFPPDPKSRQYLKSSTLTSQPMDSRCLARTTHQTQWRMRNPENTRPP